MEPLILIGISRLENLCAQNPEDDELAVLLEKICSDLKANIHDGQTTTRRLWKYLKNWEYTVVIAKCFPKLVLQMLYENVPLKLSVESSTSDENFRRFHTENSILLGKLVVVHPDVLHFSLKYFDIYPSPFEWIGEEYFNNLFDCDLAECCYNFLNIKPSHFRNKWKWSRFISYFMNIGDSKIRWLTHQCITIILGMTEHQSNRAESGLDSDFLLESLKNEFKSTENGTLTDRNESEEILDVNDHVVNVSGVLLPKFSTKRKEQKGILIPVKSTLDNLRSLALAIVSGKAACLVGPVGSGKTSLVEHLACITGRGENDLKKVQLGDQTDSRSLLGTYRCTDIPGEFVWQPGVLTRAVQKGQWLLMEDIDCAATDIASVLSSLLERNVLSVPGYRDSIPVSPGFQLFFTQRTLNAAGGYHKSQSNAGVLLQKHWTQINVEPLSKQELITIVEEMFPKLKTVSAKIVNVFMLFSVGSHQNSIHYNKTESPLLSAISSEITEILNYRSGRLISTRDLIKWCSRVPSDFDVSSSESALELLQNAIDIFTCSFSEQSSRKNLSRAISAILGIRDTQAEYYCTSYKPKLELKTETMHIGRALIRKKEALISEVNLNERKVTFSFTRPSMCLLERIACCLRMKEPVLLVGETGTGKTSSVQYLAKRTGNKLLVINMNQQSDSSDLLGGYKPVDIKYIISPVRKEFEYLFRSYFDVVKNTTFLENVSKCFNASEWRTLLVLMKQSQSAAIKRLESDNSRKRKLNESKSLPNAATELKNQWIKLGEKLEKLEKQIKSQASLAFSFIEGSLIKALKEGYWVLLDEINLASAETLECLSGLLESHTNSINLLERGDDFYIGRHGEFKLFACMNPATDVGKKDLPVGLRNRFTEFYVDELIDKNDLLLLIGDYLKDLSLPPAILESIYKFYVAIGKEAKLNLTDGTGQSPHYSLRTLCRALSIAASTNCGTITRTLYESFCLSFLTQLDSSSHPRVEKMIASAVLGKKPLNSVLKQPIPCPKHDKDEVFLPFEGYWICKGPLEPVCSEDYILTSSVRKNLRDLARIISLGKLPILLQGDTSVGKTSLITYLAKDSGNRCVRINNHQHTDIQEYIGSYATDASGKLIFREGVLVEAMRKGYWIILDELNLAPSDVLEALNRVLDDNKELFIPETQQVVKAHPKFMLFATQNPPGLYGGRNVLSRAFRNRFVELHFDEIPRSELEVILHKRCHMPLSYCKKVLSVMAELQARRRNSAAVQGKQGFITLRDLFRWGQRYKMASDENSAGKYYDWDQHIADEGYLVLAGRVRNADERSIIQEVLQKHIKRAVEPNNLFSLHEKTSSVTRNILEALLCVQNESFSHIVWTFNMRRLAVLVAKSFHFKEPVLLVGETGCGKTTVCQILAAIRRSQLTSVNCHMHTESSDFLGGLRPVRHHENDDNRLFEWVDGPLIEAMKSGAVFLADEISLADDSVLERLNSLLEPERQILLSEKGLNSDDNLSHLVVAEEEFRFIGTMNPGGDYGKKELSPALRNRFTEIWCDSIATREDLSLVLRKSLDLQREEAAKICDHILDFVDWIKSSKISDKIPCTIRDLLAWTYFINEITRNKNINVYDAYLHGAALVFLDSFGTGALMSDNVSELISIKREAVEFLINQIVDNEPAKVSSYEKLLLNNNAEIQVAHTSENFGIEPFYIDVLQSNKQNYTNFNFLAPTTGINTLRLLRGLQLRKAILLEGSPGVGKTTLVTALAKVSGHRILRINLSDQTDISDLFGADLPTADGSFKWKDGEFLSALKNGDWILLDELNLAPQSVLEGLNACLDHRGEIFIPELGRTFVVREKTKIFACQNPLRQGGARRGLPKSFLNRFTQVYIDTLSSTDLKFILSAQYPLIPQKILDMMIEFNETVLKEVTEMKWGYKGSPWELNLRDIQRWCDGLMKDHNKGSVFDQRINSFQPGKFAKILYVDRMRTRDDKRHVERIFQDVFHPDYLMANKNPKVYITKKRVHIGDSTVDRCFSDVHLSAQSERELLILRHQIPALKSLMECVEMNWLSILIGPTASGKTSSVQVLSEILGKELKILSVTSAMDTADFLGGFEQADYNRRLEEISSDIENMILIYSQQWFLNNKTKSVVQILNQWEAFKEIDHINHDGGKKQTMEKETEIFTLKRKHLDGILDMLMSKEKGCESRIQEIRSELKNLTLSVTKDGSINAGGKFEWVDSILIKCLLNGCWLLVDNVNLCSSAVLDRLNCLLETGGSLTIPERGDEISIIKPHPNFRMFFTMDPKNGEISRAMRNRGVEIYMMSNEDFLDASITDVVPFLDLSALLKSSGLASHYHEFFIEMHKLLCSFIKCFEKPSQCHLIQAANLTHQQLSRGEKEFNAIVNSFSDVYIKPRSSADFLDHNTSLAECKTEMLKSLCDNTKDFILKTSQTSSFSNHTLSCRGLCRMSSFERVKQDLYFLERTLCDKKTDFSVFFKLSHLFYNVYHFSNIEDASVRYNFIGQLIIHLDKTIDPKMADFCSDLNRNLFDCIHENFGGKAADYPWDLAVLNDITKEINTDSNNTSLYLYFIALKSQHVECKHENLVRIIDHSKSIANGAYNDVYNGSVLIESIHPLIDKLDKCIGSILTNGEMIVTNEELCKWMLSLNWFNRFLRCCDLPLFDDPRKRSKIRRESVDDVILHYKWLSKHLIRGLGLEVGIKTILSEIDKSLASTNSPLKVINKKYCKIIGQPALYKNEDAYHLSRVRQRIIRNSVRTKLLMRSPDLIVDDVKDTEIGLFDSIGNTFDCPEERIVETLRILDDDVKVAISVRDGSRPRSRCVRLWPVNDFIAQKIFSLYHARMLNEFRNEIEVFRLNGEIGERILSFIKRLKYFPIKLNALMLYLTEKSDDCVSLNKYSSEIWDLISQYKENSPACHSNFWLNYLNSPTNIDDEPVKYEALPLSFPHLTYYCMKFVVNNELNSSQTVDENVVPVSLIEWKERLNHLKYLHSLLWKNICISSSDKLQNVHSDAKIIMLNYQKMIICLEHALFKDKTDEISTDSSDRNIKSLINNCISKITDLYEKPDKFFTDEMLRTKDQFVKCLTESAKLFSNLGSSEDNIKTSMLTGSLWTLTGVCNVILLTDIGTVDAIRKDQLKVDYLKEDLRSAEFLLGGKVMHNVLYGTISVSETETKDIISCCGNDEMIPSNPGTLRLYQELVDCYPHHSTLLNRRHFIDHKIKSSFKTHNFRPSEPTYIELVKEYEYFKNSLGSIDAILHHYNNMKKGYFILNNSGVIKELSFIEDSIRSYSTWKYSVKNFYGKISEKFSMVFPDLVIPFLNGITQLCYGLDLLKNCIKKQMIRRRFSNLDENVENLIRFPTMTVDAFSSESFIGFLKKSLHGQNQTSTSECYRLLKVNYQELYSKCVSDDSIERVSWNNLMSVLTEFVTMWQKQCDSIEKAKQEKDSLYITKCAEPTEEEQTEHEINEMFPSYVDMDFVEFKQPTLESKKASNPSKDNKSDDVQMCITPSDINWVVRLHSTLMREYTSAEWLKRTADNEKSCDYTTPLLDRYRISASILDNVCQGLDESLDSKILPSLLVLISQSRNIIEGLGIDSDEQSNFYQSSCVMETKKCLPILEEIKERTGALLQEWPDFPLLNDIMTVVDRILDFPITSPIVRFLTGIELLRDKIEEWNKNSRKSNSMEDLALSLAQQIVTWRKLELSSWRLSLNSSFERLQSEANKWWFHIFTLIDCYISEKSIVPDKKDNIMNCRQFTEAMQNFIEKSPLAEYNKRLEILYVMHCHCIHFPPSIRRDEALCILWNIYKYYSQFSDQVVQAIKEKRAPIEKKLKDFVKICTWERDLSYWAVKDIVDRAHKTLHKHIKEFEGILRNMANCCFSIESPSDYRNDSFGLWDRPKRSTNPISSDFSVDVQSFVISSRVYKKFFMTTDETTESNTQLDLPQKSLLLKIESLTFKAKDICKNIIAESTYPDMLSNYDNFVTQIIESSQYLKSLEVSPGLTKEKQKSQAKFILQQKKKALSDLFQNLSHIGISYRTGLMELATKNGDIIDFMLSPLDLESSLSYFKPKRCDRLLVSQWKGCDLYFQRCISRMRGLNVVLMKPATEVGLENIERFKGFAAHLMLIAQEQKIKLCKYFKVSCYLRRKIQHLTDFCESKVAVRNQSTLSQRYSALKETFGVVITAFEQFKLVLNSIPDDSSECVAFDDVFLKNSFMKCHKNDESWNYLNTNTKQIIALAVKQRDCLNSLRSDPPITFEISKKLKYGALNNFTESDVEIIENSIKTIEDIINTTQEMMRKFSDVDKSFYNPIMDTVEALNKFLHVKLTELKSVENSVDMDVDNVSEMELSSKIESLLRFILITIQENRKRCDEDTIEKENGESLQLERNMLRLEFREKLISNISKLQLSQICHKVDSIMDMMNNGLSDDESFDRCKAQLSKLVPLLEQISLFAQFYITQHVTVHRISCKMLSIILNIFIELGSKGFCTPEEYKDDMQNEGPGKQSGGLGLGDGEGQKDVSEEIENQDQLEDAIKPGEEKSEEKKDCKEESKGIEMSDDFDAHLQDVENKDEDSDENSDGDDDADKQMGETEPDADKLDKQLWGSDDEDGDDNEENKNQENEEHGSGKPMDDKQIGAKDDNNKDTEDDVGEDNEDRRKKKNDINEMNEPEEDNDHIDPYHGKQEPLPEPEPMDLPDNLNVDDEDNEKQNEDEPENNPFEIDVMKNEKVEEKEAAEEKQEDKKEKNDPNNDSDDDESDEEATGSDVNDKKDPTQDEQNDPDNVENEEKQLDQSADEENKDDDAEENMENDKNNKKNDMKEETAPEENEESTFAESQPSHDKPSNEDDMESAETETGSKDMAQTNPQIDKEKEPAPFEQSQEQDGDEEQGTGQSELSMDQKGHMSNRKDKPQSASKNDAREEEKKRPEKRNKPGSTDEDRALGKTEEPFKKKSKTINTKNKEDQSTEQEEDGADENEGEENIEIYRHIKEAKETDAQVVDAATDDQAKKQTVPNKPEDENVEEVDANEDIAMDETKDVDLDENMSEEIKPEKMNDAKNKKNEKTSNQGEAQDEATGELGVEVEGEKVLTSGVERGSETTYHTKLESKHASFDSTLKSNITGSSIRQSLQNYQISNVSSEQSSMWHTLWGKTSSQARLLTEKLRLVLEPTGLSRLAGDYRTGKRINMRRVIPYIASHFRKDRIWLRRTRPARREYRIAVAMDDSSSMCDNQSKELAFESLALVSQALNLLEAGDLSVLSFGEDTKILHPFSEQFTESCGSKLVHNLTFAQKKTRIAQMLDFASAMFEELCSASSAPNAKLLLIVSDGRGIFSEGETKVLQTIRRARQQGIFVVYLIVDNPKNETSIMDVRVPLFDPSTNQLKCIQPYLDTFPFPFYLILRDITMLPSVLSDAMRQWFELAANMDK